MYLNRKLLSQVSRTRLEQGRTGAVNFLVRAYLICFYVHRVGMGVWPIHLWLGFRALLKFWWVRHVNTLCMSSGMLLASQSVKCYNQKRFSLEECVDMFFFLSP